jgi:hypothetical protein
MEIGAESPKETPIDLPFASFEPEIEGCMIVMVRALEPLRSIEVCRVFGFYGHFRPKGFESATE